MTSTTTEVSSSPGTWTRPTGRQVQWSGPPQPWGRDLPRLSVTHRHRGTGEALIDLETGHLEPYEDAGDAEAVSDAFGHGTGCTLPAGALPELFMAIGAVLKAEGLIPGRNL
ncbi:MAG TPA: hypothetical protein VMU94_11140 [Streptosporangiaceae bacterium]|nr:hypothetical protein [Streptosporangiaceae bacterium]